MQSLHLIDTHAAATSLMFHAQRVARETDARHAFVYVGPQSLHETAVEVGLPSAPSCPDVAWNNPRAWLELRRILRIVGRCRRVHCLSLRALGIARLVARHTPATVTLAWMPRPESLGRLDRFALDHRDARFEVTHPAIGLALTTLGVASDRIEAVEPVVDASRLEADKRGELCAEWGVSVCLESRKSGATGGLSAGASPPGDGTGGQAASGTRLPTHFLSDSTRIVAVLADPPWTTDALKAMMAIGLAREAGREVVMLVGPRATGLHRARHVAHRFERGPRIVLDARVEQPWRSLPGCDVAVALTPGLSAHWAMAAGLPVLAPDTPQMRHTLAGYARARFAAPDSVGDLARKLAGLVPGSKFQVSS